MKPSHPTLRNLDPHPYIQWGVLTTFIKSHFLRRSKIDPQRCIETFTSTTFVLLCFVGSRIFGLVYFKLHSTGRYSCITASQLLFYLQHWTRLTNIQTNTQARLELTKQGLQSFFERDPYNLEQNLLWQWWREMFIILCAHGPGSVGWNDLLSLLPNHQVILFTIIELFNEEEEINHHGSTRYIGNQQQQTDEQVRTLNIFQENWNHYLESK